MKPGWKNDVHWRQYYEDKHKGKIISLMMRKATEVQMRALDEEATKLVERIASDVPKNEPRH
jgi:hypothetical protein